MLLRLSLLRSGSDTGRRGYLQFIFMNERDGYNEILRI